MITSPRVFEDEHLPRELIHRDAELQTLTRAWKPVRHGERAGDIILSGPSGVGKTVLLRHALDRLERAAAVGTAHVPCLGATTSAILRTILEDFGHNAPGNHPIDDLRWTLQDIVEEPVVVVLDEADGLAGNDALESHGDPPAVAGGRDPRARAVAGRSLTVDSGSADRRRLHPS